jgi:hypothetical protein
MTWCRGIWWASGEKLGHPLLCGSSTCLSSCHVGGVRWAPRCPLDMRSIVWSLCGLSYLGVLLLCLDCGVLLRLFEVC